MLLFATTCMEPEDVTLTENKSDRERQILCDLIYTWVLKQNQHKFWWWPESGLGQPRMGDCGQTVQTST